MPVPEGPSMIVNIGTGVSVLYVGEDIERVTGTCIGGGTLLGLATAILGVSSYEEILDLCEIGEPSNCDFMLTDIYGPDAPSTLAVSLGKISLEDPENFKREDIAKSLINMISYNIG